MPSFSKMVVLRSSRVMMEGVSRRYRLCRPMIQYFMIEEVRLNEMEKRLLNIECMYVS